MEPEERQTTTPRPATGARAKRQRAVRSRLTAAALQLFTERGYDATTVDDIVAAGKTSRSTFFRYFGTKDDVVLSRLDDVGDDWVRHCRSLLTLHAPGEALAEGMRLAVHEAATDPTLYELMLLAVTNPTLLSRLQAKIEDWRANVHFVTAEYVGCGLDDLRPAVLTYLVAGAGSAAFTSWLAGGGQRDVAALVDEALAYARPGYEGILFEPGPGDAAAATRG
jgi:AcrR family transcriptional regulator